LNEAYAIQSGYLAQFPVKVVGGSAHEELWVPAEALAEFNRRIVGPIRVTHQFRAQ